jgi:hypothetical protein
MSANVIEITLRGVNETQGLTLALGNLKKSLVGLVAGVGTLKVLKDIAVNVIEAERTSVKLDQAFSGVSKTIGITRKDMDDLATSIQNTTAVSDDLVKEAQVVLTTFDRVNGQAFERTIRVATDMSERLGTDLVGATRALGLALSSPDKAFERLRRSGVVLSSELKQVVEGLVESGQASKAQSLILTELERKFGGAAEAARNTLGGALQGLKNAFGELFEGATGSTSGLTDAINSLSKSLQDPNFKLAVDFFVTSLAKIAEIGVKSAGAIASIGSKVKEFYTNIRNAIPTLKLFGDSPLGSLMSAQFQMKGSFNAGVEAAAGKTAPPGVVEPLPSPITVKTVDIIKAAKIELGAYKDLLDKMNESTKTSAETQITAFYELEETLRLLRKEGVITQKQYNDRIGEAIDESLKIDLDPIRGMYKDVRVQTTELGEFMKGVWRSTGESIRQTFADAIYSGKLSLRSLVDVARRTVADILSAFLTSGLKNVFLNMFKGGGGGGGGTGFLGSLAAAFGFSAGGGKSTRPRWVGEEGRELVIPGQGGMSVYNKRQLAGMGGGSVVYQPQNTFNLIEREDPDQTKREVLEIMSIQNSKQMAEFQRALSRSGVEVRF